MNASPSSKKPDCFGALDTVFPKASDGLRHTPETCLACSHKTECLKTALKGRNGLELKNDHIDKAYNSGMITFFERWSQKKHIKSKLKKNK